MNFVPHFSPEVSLHLYRLREDDTGEFVASFSPEVFLYLHRLREPGAGKFFVPFSTRQIRMVGERKR